MATLRQFPQGETKEQKLQREVNWLQARTRPNWRTSAVKEESAPQKERHRANGYKGHATRISKRVKNGVCICCNRTFADLARHMATKHPTFTPMAVDDIPKEAAG